MRYVKSDGTVPVTVELTQRNLAALLAKLDDPRSSRSLVDGTESVLVQSVEDGKARLDEAPGYSYAPAAGGALVVELTRSRLNDLLGTVGSTVTVGAVAVVSVPDAAHYSDRPPGEVYMPSSGERW